MQNSYELACIPCLCTQEMESTALCLRSSNSLPSFKKWIKTRYLSYRLSSILISNSIFSSELLIKVNYLHLSTVKVDYADSIPNFQWSNVTCSSSILRFLVLVDILRSANSWRDFCSRNIGPWSTAT